MARWICVPKSIQYRRLVDSLHFIGRHQTSDIFQERSDSACCSQYLNDCPKLRLFDKLSDKVKNLYKVI
jgi:hypothetical protein